MISEEVDEETEEDRDREEEEEEVEERRDLAERIESDVVSFPLSPIGSARSLLTHKLIT
jgi:hypothetical protein